MAGADPVNDQLPTEEDGYKLYKAAGKLEGKKVLISGGDSGIGRAIAVLYAMEGAESTIIYLPEDEADARETERLVREQRRRVHLIQADLTDPKACRDVVDQAIDKMGRINVLVLNLGTKVMEKTIAEVTE
jgi:NAD(P)-dependent dehydrogenase (short-subunit alcohol dehydrogenase family)